MPLGLLAAVSGHPREIDACHRAWSPHTRGPFIVLILRIDDGGNGRRPWHRQRHRGHPGTGGRRSAGRWPGRGRGRRLRLSRARRAGFPPCDGARTASPIRGGRAPLRGVPDPSAANSTRCRQFDSRTGSPNGVVNTKVPGSLPTRSSTWVRNSVSTEAGTSTTRDRCVFVSRSSSTPRCSGVPRSTVSRPRSSRRRPSAAAPPPPRPACVRVPHRAGRGPPEAGPGVPHSGTTGIPLERVVVLTNRLRRSELRRQGGVQKASVAL